jgi:hypothetical protein
MYGDLPHPPPAPRPHEPPNPLPTHPKTPEMWNQEGEMWNFEGGHAPCGRLPVPSELRYLRLRRKLTAAAPGVKPDAILASGETAAGRIGRVVAAKWGAAAPQVSSHMPSLGRPRDQQACRPRLPSSPTLRRGKPRRVGGETALTMRRVEKTITVGLWRIGAVRRADCKLYVPNFVASRVAWAENRL